MKRIGTRDQVERALDAIGNQGGEVALAAANLATGEEVGRNAERSMPTASVFKLPLLVEVYRPGRRDDPINRSWCERHVPGRTMQRQRPASHRVAGGRIERPQERLVE
jgi:hypothetical protein